MKLNIKIFVLAIFTLTVSCYRETVVFDSEPDAGLKLSSVIRINGKDAFLDSKLNMMRFSVSSDSLNNFSAFTTYNEKSEVWFEEKELFNNQVNAFGKIEVGIPYTLKVKYEGVISEFDFVFTNLPIVQIITDTKIWDEPKSLGRIVIAEPDKTAYWSSYAGIEYRGQSSRYLDKKSIGFRLWQNTSDRDVYSESLLGFKRNSDWILNSAAVDLSGIRNLVSFIIWSNMDTIESGGEAKHPGVNLKIAELFINNRCQGFYIFSEYVNQQLLSAAPEDVLYKAIDWADGATKFENYDPDISSNCIWNGWEQIIPDCDNLLRWENLNNLYEIVVNSDDTTFKQKISRYIDIENFIDYFLFVNLTFAGDNTGKNIFLYRKNNSGLFQIIPWDLDATWGRSFDGSTQNHEGILTNSLYHRLFETNPDNFITQLKLRWTDLRKTHFTESDIREQFAYHFQELQKSGVINVENRNWGNNMNLQSEQVYIGTWLAKRLTYLDSYFNTLE